MTLLLRSASLTVRTLARHDASELLQSVLESKADLAAWENWAVGEYTEQMALEFATESTRTAKSGFSHTFALIDPSTERLVGTTTLRMVNKDNNFANLGYWVHSSFTGRGLATAGAQAVADFGFDRVGYTRIEMVIHPDNVASIKVAQKLGATYEGTLRNRLVHVGVPKPGAMYGLTPESRRA